MAFNSSSPAYKKAASANVTVHAPKAANPLAGILGSLLGGSTPAYKTVGGGQSSRAPDSPGLLRIFVGTTPSYKMAQSMTPEFIDEEIDEQEEDAGDGCPPTTDTVVLL